MQRSDMVQQSDIKGRLNLLRYGLVVLVVVTFLVAILAPYAMLRNIQGVTPPPVTDFLGTAVIAAIIVAILSVIVYFAYARLLQRTVNQAQTTETSSET